MAEHLRECGLPETETQVAILLAKGYTIERISKAREIAVNTVKKHLTRIYSKTNAGGGAQLIYRLHNLRKTF